MLQSLAENTDLDGGLLDHFAYGFFETEIEELNLMVVGEIHEPSVVGKNPRSIFEEKQSSNSAKQTRWSLKIMCDLKLQLTDQEPATVTIMLQRHFK